MALTKLNIVRDCWWMNPSGTSYMIDETGQMSTQSHGLYKSLNSNDSQYIQFCGSGINSVYYFGRLPSTTTAPDRIVMTVRASGVAQGSWVNVQINNLSVGSFGNFTGLQNITKDFDLTTAQKQRILNGRVNDNYDYIGIRLTNSGVLSSTKLYNVDIWYSGGLWDNYTGGLPNVLSTNCYPKELRFRAGSTWVNQNNGLVNGSGYYHINQPPSGAGTDNTYIRQVIPPNLVLNNFGTRSSRRPGVGPSGYNGGLSLVFNVDALDPLTQITRAQLTLRMSLPPSGQYENARDTFEINGYNYRFKEQDFKEDMSEEIGSIPKKAALYGYYTYGAGGIVEQSGFMSYTTELVFLDPYQPYGNFASTKYRNIDILDTMEFKIVGLPSGTLLSAAQLYLEYLPNESLGLYTVGGVELKRKYIASNIDVGGSLNPLFGNGAWHHRGNLNEGEIFDAFYRLDEIAGSSVYPTSLNAASGCYGICVNAIYEYPVYEGEELVDIEYDIIPIEPTRKNYYRNAVRTEFGPAYDPTYYRTMIYNGSPFVPYDVHDPNASVYSSGISQIYFDDKMVFGTDCTLYFMLYREPTNDGQNFAQIFHRGQMGSAGWANYEIMGLLQTEDVTFIVRDVNDNVHQLVAPIPVATLEPILVWFTCKHNTDDDTTTIKLNVHTDVKHYFTNDWVHVEKTFPFARKMYEAGLVKTMLGPLYTPSDLDQQLAFTSFFSYVSLCEFGWADSCIELDYNTVTTNTRTDYDISSENSKRFFASRLCNSDYLHDTEYAINTIGGDPLLDASGWLLPSVGMNQPWTSPTFAPWINPGNIVDKHPTYTYTTLINHEGFDPSDRSNSYELYAKGFDINLPSGTVVQGIATRLYCKATPTNQIYLQAPVLELLYDDGGRFYGGKPMSYSPNMPTNWDYKYVGGPTNMWQLDTRFGYNQQSILNFLNDPYLALNIAAINNWNLSYASGDVYIDHVELAIYTSSGIYSGTSALTIHKSVDWQVPYGSGGTQWSTQYSNDDWIYDAYQLYNPITTAGTHNLVHPSAIYVELEYDHNTNHPSGLNFICDVEFDTGSTDNWKVCRLEATLPSGSNVTKTVLYSKHIGMNGEPVLYSDVSKISVNVTTKYADVGSTSYYGDVKIKSLKVYFDSYAASVTGVSTLELYTKGGPTVQELDLFTEGHIKYGQDRFYLYIIGSATPGSGQMPLYTLGDISVTNNTTLYTNGIPYYNSGTMPLFTKALPFTIVPLYIEGLTPGYSNNDVDLFTYATPAGVGGLYTRMSLVTKAMSPFYFPLFIYNSEIGANNTSIPLYLLSTPLPTNTIPLYTVGPSGVNSALYMYIRGLGTTDGALPYNNAIKLYMARNSEAVMNALTLTVGQVGRDGILNLYLSGEGVQSSSVPLYIKGSGLPTNNKLKFYTHGY